MSPATSAPSPFHAGEQTLQARAGLRERMEEVGQRMIRDHMPEQHRELFCKLPTLVAGGIDAAGQPWATMLAGSPGFVSAPDARTLHIAALPHPGDPLADGLAPGQPTGLLGLEPHTRRRNRMNGRVRSRDGDGWSVAVGQSFGNCPQYIQAREPAWVADRRPGIPVEGGARLTTEAARLVAAADTLFIASASLHATASAAPGEGVDVSHRGGRPGFVRVGRAADGAAVLSLPDFRGNFLFNTLGNLMVRPLAGLLFFDPEHGHLLHVAARAEIVWEGPEVEAFEGAQHLLHLHVLRHVWRPHALPLRWSPAQAASQLATTGIWHGAA